MEVKPRTQADRSAATRAALLAAARPLFAAHGFTGVGTEAIVAAAGVTRGALYHQFGDKAELFAAVFEELEAELAMRMGDVVLAAGVTDPVAALRVGASAWLEACAEPEVHRIVLVEAPAVLGWARWREIGLRYGVGLVEGVLSTAIDAGAIKPIPVRPLAHLLIGALDEAALYVAGTEDREAAGREVLEALEAMIAGLVVI